VKAAATRNSTAVIVEWIRFLRKQVTGGRNGLAGKATDSQGQSFGAGGTQKSEDLLGAYLRFLGAALIKNARNQRAIQYAFSCPQ
jgi:hypothetical protein